jgi:hypothetical protein
MNKPLVSQRDPDIERRRALVKVYMLLLRLAEEAESKSTSSTLDPATPSLQKVRSPATAREGLSSQ